MSEPTSYWSAQFVYLFRRKLICPCAFVYLWVGHAPGRPVFGSKFVADGENLLMTWGVDGRLCLWDSFSHGNINAPLAVLVANTNYPIYAVDARPSYVVVGGGDSSEISFMGVPVMIYDTATSSATTTMMDAGSGSQEEKA